MTPFYSDDWLTLYGGDCREVLASLPADSVDCVVTSPPYWGLRDYGTATWEGGAAECDHDQRRRENDPSSKSATSAGQTRDSVAGRTSCRKCGATRIDSQLGLERTPEEYVANMVAVFREVRRVLKPSGTCWLNLGDSYAASGAGNNGNEGYGDGRTNRSARLGGRGVATLKPKDLVGIPWRVAFALQADGWYLRSDIIWSKPNPMPESVTDRPTKSHEYLFLLTKSARYYFDADAVREPAGEWPGHEDKPQGFNGKNGSSAAFRAIRSAGRNIRSVWTIATRPYPGAHFAVFPPELPERCIKAGSSEKGVCPECGAPWERETVRTIESTWQERKAAGAQPGWDAKDGLHNGARHQQPKRGSGVSSTLRGPGNVTTGWRATCSCRNVSDIPAPAVILDPFGGSGTVGMVANRLSRRAILIDLNPAYLQQQLTRNSQTPLGLTEGTAS